MGQAPLDETLDERIEIDVWAEDSWDGNELCEDLEKAGWKVKRFYDSSSTPTIMYNDLAWNGYEDIYHMFIFPNLPA